MRGTITVVMDSWCALQVDGVDYGRIDARGKTVDVAPGEHDVVCAKDGVENARFGQRLRLAAGENRVVRGQLLAKVTVTVGTHKALVLLGTTYSRGDQLSLMPGRQRVEIGNSVSYIDIPRVRACTLKDTGDVDHPVDCFP